MKFLLSWNKLSNYFFKMAFCFSGPFLCKYFRLSYISIQVVYNWSITHSQHSREKMKTLFSHTALCPQMIPVWTRKIHHCCFRTICQTKTIQNRQNYSVGLNQEFLLFSPILWSVTIVLSSSCFSCCFFSRVYFYLNFRPPEYPETTSKPCFPT